MIKMNKMSEQMYEPVHVLEQEEHMKKQMQLAEEMEKMTFSERMSSWWNQTNSPGGSSTLSEQ